LTRDVGKQGIPAGYILIGGLDPASAGYQASVCLAYNPTTEHYALVDLENELGGGIDAFLARMENWHDRFGLSTWVVETNNLQAIFTEDPRVKDLARERGILLRPHMTNWNKHDPAHGVVSMGRMFREQMIDLPYLSGEAKAKMKVLERQLIAYDPGTVKARKRKGTRTDVVMALWFAYLETHEIRKRARSVEGTVAYDDMSSYPGYRTASMNTAPWGSTYPGGRR
jgi:hypothetical protein